MKLIKDLKMRALPFIQQYHQEKVDLQVQLKRMKHDAQIEITEIKSTLNQIHQKYKKAQTEYEQFKQEKLEYGASKALLRRAVSFIKR